MNESNFITTSVSDSHKTKSMLYLSINTNSMGVL